MEKCRRNCEKRVFKEDSVTLRPLIIVPGGLITSTGVVLVVLVVVLVVLGVVLIATEVAASRYCYD